jgi:hypothetical protein
LEEIFQEELALLKKLRDLDDERYRLRNELRDLQPKEPTFLPIPSVKLNGVMPFMRP